MSYLIVAILILGLVAYVSQMILESSYKDYDSNGEPIPVNNYYEPIVSEVNITTEPNTEVIDLRKNKGIVAEAVEEAVEIVKQDMLGYIGAPGENTLEATKIAIEEAIVIENEDVVKATGKTRTRKPRAKKEVVK